MRNKLCTLTHLILLIFFFFFADQKDFKLVSIKTNIIKWILIQIQIHYKTAIVFANNTASCDAAWMS